MTHMDRMKELVTLLNQAAKAYYQEDREIMDNREYDALYSELEHLEAETGTILAGSPTQSVGYESVEELPKETHPSPMLSLDKTKERQVLKNFIGDQKTLLSWKMDGLTIVLTYQNGTLAKAVTRGNGVVGEVVTNNARVFDNLPLKIPFQGELVLRGEAIITYSDFEKINREIEDVDAKYKNPRNLCSGSVRQLNNEITAKRHVRFYAFSLVSAQDTDFENSNENKMLWLQKQGFEIVEYRVVTQKNLDETIDYFSEKIAANDFPSDGLVALYDNISYGESLGTTSKFPRNAFAFKWADEMRETRLLEMEWSPSRTGLINPVAIFEPVELEGTTVSRASVHNISIVKALELGIGDTITVYKANMIIPQIAENLTRSGALVIPDLCPVCGGEARILCENDVETLNCTNPDCQAKKIKAFSHFVSRDAMNIDGMSEATLEKFIARGFIHEFGDIFLLSQHKDEIVTMEGFGEKSYERLMNSIQKSSVTTLPRFIYSLGILNIGLANAKVLCKEYNHDFAALRTATVEDLSAVDGIGPIIAKTFVDYFTDEVHNRIVDHLLTLVTIEKPEESADDTLKGKVFVITGSVNHFANRNELKAFIESKGGKVTGSVTGKTSYLINNDTASTSSKNKKARELGIPILSEEDFIEMTR
ncbi:MAG: NAD-dependent DNA ligase LigA [Lachnospiraceae bacterium]|nr:NAD-dependent DNA ligase LigA [Lachnospiraceae bacterium]